MMPAVPYVEHALHAMDPDAPRSPDSGGPESSFQLVLKARAGDRAACEALFARYHTRLQRWAHGRLPAWARGSTDTLDLVQDTMLQVFRRLDEFEPKHAGAFLGYVRRTLNNTITDRIRFAQRRGILQPLDSTRASEEPSQQEELVATQLLERYEAAMEVLKPDYRDAIIARVELRLPWDEVMAVLGKPSIPAAQVTVSRALVRLARHMAHDRK
jgi:RNA polymerase sigma-70 factor, ECF subfamily